MVAGELVGAALMAAGPAGTLCCACVKASRRTVARRVAVLSFPRRYLQDNDVQRGAIVKDRNSRRCEESTRKR